MNEAAATAVGSVDRQSPETRLLVDMNLEMVAVRKEHPDWYAEYEDADPVTAPLDEVRHLLNTAPTDYCRGLLTGVMMFRQQLSILTGRSH